MSEIYGGASLTLAAEASPKSSSGIFAGSQTGREEANTFQFTIKAHSHQKELKGEIYLRSQIKSPWEGNNSLSKRAWVLQEWLLSPRVMHFTENQMYWKCQQEHLAETAPQRLGHLDSWLPNGHGSKNLDLTRGEKLDKLETWSQF